MNLIKRGTGKNWTAVWMWRGRKFSRSTGVSNKKQAEVVASSFLAAQKSDRLDLLESSKLRRTVPSIAQILALYPKVATCRGGTVKANLAEFRRMLKLLDLHDSAPISVLDRGLGVRFAAIARSRGWSDTGITSCLRLARSVFARHLLPSYGVLDAPGWLKAPNPKASPIRGFQPIPWASWAQIVRGVHALNDPAIYRAFLLMARCGLGNNEVVHSRGTWLVENGIRIEPRDGWRPKSHNRVRTVPMRAIRYNRYFAALEGKDELLVPDGLRRIARRMNPIIRKALPGRTKSAYELRKLAGSVVATRDGIFAAGKFLGDNSATVEKYYAALLRPLKPI